MSTSWEGRPCPTGRLGALAALLALAGTSACEAIPRTTLEGEDESVFFPSGRVSWQLDPLPREASTTQEASQREPWTSMRFELDLSYGSGAFSQELRDGEIIQVGSVPFPGPGPVEVEADLWTADVYGRIERRWPNGLGIGGRVGLRFSDLDLTLSAPDAGPGLRDGTSLTSGGVLAGVEGSYEPIDWLRLFASGSLSLGIELSGVSSGYEGISSTTLDLGAAMSLGRSVQLAAGWRRLDYEADSAEKLVFSDLDLVLSGPFLGLWLSF